MMVRAVPSVAFQEAIHDVLRVGVLEENRRDRGDFRPRRTALGANVTTALTACPGQQFRREILLSARIEPHYRTFDGDIRETSLFCSLVLIACRCSRRDFARARKAASRTPSSSTGMSMSSTASCITAAISASASPMDILTCRAPRRAASMPCSSPSSSRRIIIRSGSRPSRRCGSIDLALTQLEKNRDTIELALNASDIERINKAGKIAAVLDLEGGFDLDGDLGVLRDLYRLGLRSAQLSAAQLGQQFCRFLLLPGEVQRPERSRAARSCAR